MMKNQTVKVLIFPSHPEIEAKTFRVS